MDWMPDWSFHMLPADEIVRNAVLIGLSSLLVLMVLLLLGGIYRAHNTDLAKPVSTTLAAGPGEILLAPRHLAHPSAHEGKTPKVEFWIHLPNTNPRRVAIIPLKIKVQRRNSSTIHDQHYKDAKHGGQIGIDDRTRSEIEAFGHDLFAAEGRRVDVDTDHFEVRLKYPGMFNIAYLLRDHPDSAVRISAWIFILTSMFSVVQSMIMQWLGFR